MPSFWLALFYFAPLFVFLHSLLSTRRCPPCLSLTSSHHLMPAVFVPLCHDISACTPTLLPLSPSPCNWQSSPLSSSLSALSSFLLRFPATVYIHSARPPPHSFPLFVCIPHLLQIYLLFHWYVTRIIGDDKVYQRSPWWQSAWIFIWIQKRLRACLSVVAWLKCQLNLCISLECMAAGPMNNWQKTLELALSSTKFMSLVFKVLQTLFHSHGEPRACVITSSYLVSSSYNTCMW